MFYQYQHLGLNEYFCKEYGDDFSFPNHLHHSFEFITVLSGSMKVTVDSKVYCLKENEALLIFPYQLHSLSSDHCKHMLCIFAPELVKSYATKTSGKIPENNKFSPDNYLINLLNNLDEHSSTIEKKGLLYSLCSQLEKETAYKKRTADTEYLLHKIFEFIENNYKNNCTLENLSKTTGFSYSYLSRYFKKIVGISFNAFVNQYRISNACYMLNNSGYSILQCAYECGYSSLRSFNRNFKMLLSVTPQEYRTASKNSELMV